MSKNPRLLLIVLGFVAAAFVLTTCGIEQFSLLEPPGQIIEIDDDLFKFQKTSGNSEIYFSGFELYYKMYQADATPVVDVFTYEDLAAKGFRRIHSGEDRVGSISKPLIAIDANDRTPPDNDEFVITVDFSASVPLVDFPEFYHDGSAGIDTIFQNNTSIRRDVTYTATGQENEYKKFTEFSDGDRDITEPIWDDIVNARQVQIVLYVVSYGFDYVNFKVLYSEPVYLGVERRFFDYI